MPKEASPIDVEGSFSYSLSFDSPVMVNVPSWQCTGRSQDEIKAWIWKNHEDSILSALRIEYHVPRNIQEKEEEKTETSISNKKRRSISGTENRAENKSAREHLLDTIAHVQRQFFQIESPSIVFGGLLEGLLELMESEYGFIGEIKYEEDGTMFLQMHAITNIAWNQATRQFYEDNIDTGLKFYNLDTLFGKVVTTSQPVIANDPSTDPRAGGVPEGHPPLNHFLGLPFFNHGKMTGMFGISNKPGGYSVADIDFLEPLTVTCSNLIQAYQEMRKNEYLINTLEESVKARTKELEMVNKNLEEANRQVRHNAVMQLQHFACMSHEIRTPLNCIIGMSSLLKDTKMPPMQSESIKMITASGDLLLAIVNDVLDYSKLETDHVEINVMKSDLQDMLQSILYSIEMKAQHQGQRIKAIYDPKLPVFVNTDIRRIQQILFNLLGNAVKFSRPNGIVELSVRYEMEATESHEEEPRLEHIPQHCDISSTKPPPQPQTVTESTPSRCPFHKPTSQVSSEQTVNSSHLVESSNNSDNDGSDDARPTVSSDRRTCLRNRPTCNLIFTVKDYGKGIERHDFDVIFHPFQQASGAHITESVYGGTGLGLAITKKLVAALGGTISVDSEIGCWSEFTVRLPCSDPPAPVKKLSQQLSDATVIILGLSESQQDNVLRVLLAFDIDVRLVSTLDDIEALVALPLPKTSNTGCGSISLDRRIMCMIHGEMIHPECLLSFREWQKRRKSCGLSLFTFGQHWNECQDHPSASPVMSHHIRSLEQVIPQALIEMLDDKSKLMHCTNENGIGTSTSTSNGSYGDPSTIFGVQHSLNDPGEEVIVSHEDLRVLIAEDNKINQKVLMGMLSRLNVKSIDVVENGRDAVEREACTPYDVILMDQQMPVMGGVNACRMIVSRDCRDSHPIPFIIFVTAHVSIDFEIECQAAGSAGFLPKPFKLDDIEKCLRSIAQKIADQRRGKRKWTHR